MCGIFGAIDLEGYFSTPDYDEFVALTDLVSYRGPDAAGYKCMCVKTAPAIGSDKWDVFLGHRRLAIIDLSEAGRQPMTDGQGRWLIFNGEIFNFVELRQELEQLGDHFQTKSDSEVILRVYARFGVEGFAKLNGMWAFALVDLPQRRVILSRDRFSIKPLYFTKQGRRFYFSSEIKQLLPLLSAKRLNQRAMTAFLSQLLLDHTNETFFVDVNKVPPKTSLVISLATGEISSRQYWDYEQESLVDFDRAADKFVALLEDSVRIRLRSDVRVGCLLSGGIDSSAIAWLCHRLGADNVETFSVISDDPQYSEEKFINIISSQAGVENHKLPFRTPNLLATLDTVLNHSDEPVAGFSVVAQYRIFELVRQRHDVTVLLSGQGGDEVLLGYLKFFFLYVKSLIGEGDILKAAKELWYSLVRGTVIHQFRLAEAARYAPWLGFRPYGGALSSRSDHELAPIWRSENLRERQIEDIDHYSVPALTHYEDRNSMAHSLEVRHPFLDHRLVNFLVSLPVDYKIRAGWTKYILRKSLKDLPAPIRWRRDKQGFTTAEAEWIRHDLRPLVQKMFAGSRLQQLGILDERKFLAHYQKFVKGQTGFFLDICRALIAEVWVRKEFNREDSKFGPFYLGVAPVMA